MSVRKLIREQVKRSAGKAPGAIARAVLEQLGEDELRDALGVALPYLVRDEVRKIRHHSLGRPSPRGRYAWRDTDPEPEPAPVSQERVTKLRQGGRKGFRAAQAKREREAALLATPVALAVGRWKALGDCTPKDLRSLALQCRDRAGENIARAEGYERIADDMEAAGIGAVRDYKDPGLVRQVLAHAA